MKTIKKHLKLLWRAFLEGEIGLRKRLLKEKMEQTKKANKE